MFHWLLNVNMDEVMEELEMGMGRIGVRFFEEERE